jgi:hypothetical protein
MITATCTTTNCKLHGIGYTMRGAHARVECGACHADCALTDPQPDPPQPDDA